MRADLREQVVSNHPEIAGKHVSAILQDADLISAAKEDPDLRTFIVAKINEAVNLPFLNEEQEAALIGAIFGAIGGLIAQVFGIGPDSEGGEG